MSNNSFTIKFLALLLLSYVFASFANANSSDQDKPIQVDAGKVVIKEKQGISYYSGGVKIHQGSRIISGDIITFYSKDNEISKIVIKGTPASFSQLNDQNEKIHASAKKMVFHVKKEVLVMTSEAVLQQNNNIFSSEKISYNTAKDIIMAGDKNAPANERVKITIHPKKENSITK